MNVNACNIIATLMRENGTRMQIAERSQVNVRVVDTWLASFYDAGLIRRVRAEKESISMCWAWQSKPFDKEDFAPCEDYAIGFAEGEAAAWNDRAYPLPPRPEVTSERMRGYWDARLPRTRAWSAHSDRRLWDTACQIGGEK